MRALLEALYARLSTDAGLVQSVGSVDRIIRPEQPDGQLSSGAEADGPELSDIPGCERLVSFEPWTERPHRTDSVEEATILVICFSTLGDLDVYDLAGLVKKTLHRAKLSHQRLFFFYCRWDGYESRAYYDAAHGAFRVDVRFRIRFRELD